ncbi:MAG: ankyrin repeat domain-containing protein [Sedimentisphaerales bacterium]|nr:ankyrin repeat domain-containing protein [Sedimentisphaerales bacterium]
MTNQPKYHSILKVIVLSFIILTFLSINSFAAKRQGPDPNQNSKYLNAVREFADNVLKFGRDTYGTKHTPLFVDGVNVNTHEPVKWISSDGQEWILSNLASQQNLFRTLHGLSNVTGDTKYKNAAEEAIKYAFENLQSSSGLLYWGGHSAYDAKADKPCGRGVHELKGFYPYYELMWEVNPTATRKLIEAFWTGHIMDWSNLEMNRHCYDLTKTSDNPWGYEYKGGPVFFESDGLSAHSTGSDLYYAAACLTKFSPDKEPLVWGKRLARRYVETRNTKTGFSYPAFTVSTSQIQSDDEILCKLKPIPCTFPWQGYANRTSWEIHFGYDTPSPGTTINHLVAPWICQLMLAELLGDDGKEFIQWSLEELTAWGKVSYRKEDNTFVPMCYDGTVVEGYVCKEDCKLGFKGSKLEAVPAKITELWAYIKAYCMTKDAFMWEMARNIALANDCGDLGASVDDNSKLNLKTNLSDPYAIAAFLELYLCTEKEEFLKMARRIGDNVLANRFRRGFFSPENRYTFTKFDAVDALALLNLHAAVAGEKSTRVPAVWPNTSFFEEPYRSKDSVDDNQLIYSLKGISEPPRSLQEAAAEGDTEAVKSMIARGIDIDKREDSFCKTALHRAVIGGHGDIVKLLIDAGARLDAKSEFGDSNPLHYAVENGHKDIVELLISNGADVNDKNQRGQTPLDIALGRNNEEIVEILAKLTNISSIHVAAQLGDLEKVKAFLEQGIGVNTKDESGMTPLLRAVSDEQSGMAKFLIENGADVNTGDESGFSPLVYAVWNDDPNVVKMLLDKGADVNAKDNDIGFAVLHWAVLVDNKGLTELILAAGADVNARSNTGEMPLDVAAYGVSAAIGELLVAKGAEVSSLYTAAYMGDLDKVKAFIDQGADIKQKKGMIEGTALHAAAAGGHKEVVEFLISRGADANITNIAGKTALHIAAGAGHLEIVQILLKSGSDVNTKDRMGNTALDLALEAGHTEIVDQLHKRTGIRYIAITKVSAPSSCVQGETVAIAVALDNKNDANESRDIILTDTSNDKEIARQTSNIHSKHLGASEVDLTINGEKGENNGFGDYIAIGGDVNGDGYKDFLISSAQYTNNIATGSGKAYLYYGGTNIMGNPDKIFTGENNGDMFSDGIAEMADLNNDGFDDLLIGAPNYGGAEKFDGAGRLYIFYGGPEIDDKADIIIESPDGQGSYFGFRPAAGDINNDGFLDLIVCAPMYNNRTGRVYLYYGPIASDTTADKIFTGENPGDTFGMFAIPNGDIDNDGYKDLLIVTRYYSNSTGRAYLYWGAGGTSMDTDCDMIFSDIERQQFGCGADVCDIDKDGFADIIIGSQGNKSAERGVWLYWGGPRSSFDNSADMIFTGERNSDNFGNYINIGYANKDQYPDIMINAWYYGGGIGRSYLYYGNSRDKMDNIYDLTFNTPDRGAEAFQTHLFDINNDGYGDVLRSGWKYNNYQGRVWLWYGPFNTSTDITFNWDTTNASIGKHTLNVEISPIPGEQNIEDNIKTITIEVTEPTG